MLLMRSYCKLLKMVSSYQIAQLFLPSMCLGCVILLVYSMQGSLKKSYGKLIESSQTNARIQNSNPTVIASGDNNDIALIIKSCLALCLITTVAVYAKLRL